MVQAVLTDIEGTTSSIAFVHQTLFPYAREHMAGFVRAHAHEPAVREQIDAVSAEVGTALCLDMTIQTLCDWIAADRKATALKALQGMIWEQGYRSGELKGHIYPDAVKALKAWYDAGLDLYVYSSGSVQAQQLIFGHTEYGDLRPLFSGYFDTRVGHKQQLDSYEVIAGQIALHPADILFLSDVSAELDAAAQAGMRTCQLVRPGEGQAGEGHPQARNFSEVAF